VHYEYDPVTGETTVYEREPGQFSVNMAMLLRLSPYNSDEEQLQNLCFEMLIQSCGSTIITLLHAMHVLVSNHNYITEFCLKPCATEIIDPENCLLMCLLLISLTTSVHMEQKSLCSTCYAALKATWIWTSTLTRR